MAKRESHLGSAYKALDLHIHTPASEGYQDKTASAADIVAAAINAGLHGICITDHNTAASVDSVCDAAKGKPLVVFPGVEISVTGGKEGPVHIIGIFAPGRTSEELNDFLSAIGLTAAKRGKTDELANGSPSEVIDKIAEHDGIPVLAHAESSHGVLHDMRGRPRIETVQNKKLVAAEASNVECQKFLDGTDPDYQRFLPTYEASDAHSLSDIGKKRTYFKVQDLSFASLRGCFIDPGVRILLQEEYEQLKNVYFPRIVRIAISQGFFHDQEVHFHPCHNTLIGSQGVGKSLLVEFIRFALDQPSGISEIATDASSKLKQQLGYGGQITLEIQLSSKNHYEVKRVYNDDDNPVEVINPDTGESYRGEVARLFPIVAYSQTEAVYIARNPYAQLELIDRFLDTPSFERTISEVLSGLRENDRELAEVLSARESLIDVDREIQTVGEEIKNLEKSLQNPVLDQMLLAEQQKAAFETELAYHDTLVNAVTEFSKELTTVHKPAELAPTLAENQRLKQASELSRSCLTSLASDLQASTTKLKASRSAVEGLFGEWMPEYGEVEAQYKEFLFASGGNQQNLEVRRKVLEDRRKSLQEQADALRTQSERHDAVLESRNILLDRLDEAASRFYVARKTKYDELTIASDGKLLLGISPGANIDAFASALQTIATGTKIRKTDLAQIAKALTPREFVDLVLAKDKDAIAVRSGVGLEACEKLVGWLNALEAQEDVLALQHQYIPQDVPSIKFRKDDGNYYDLSELSVGQKCTALLIIALSAGDSPILIDQPEESIDIASVFSDIVSKLRSGKDRRQFLLTTHNPNIAVTADSDLIHVLKSSATEGQIVNQGVIEDEAVRHEVIQHLEGGEDAYLLRGKKYGLLEA